jgi:hypothetical protein
VSGCTSARFIIADPNGGVVAIPSNKSGFPFYYREDAEKLMAQKCPQGYVIDREEEVVVGKVSTVRNTNNTQSSNGDKKQSFSSLVTSESTQTHEVHDQTEYRIIFHGK